MTAIALEDSKGETPVKRSIGAHGAGIRGIEGEVSEDEFPLSRNDGGLVLEAADS